jgi:hypothetical protein
VDRVPIVLKNHGAVVKPGLKKHQFRTDCGMILQVATGWRVENHGKILLFAKKWKITSHRKHEEKM